MCVRVCGGAGVLGKRARLHAHPPTHSPTSPPSVLAPEKGCLADVALQYAFTQCGLSLYIPLPATSGAAPRAAAALRVGAAALAALLVV